MAESVVRTQRWVNGVMVEETQAPKPADAFNRETIEERALAALADNLAFVNLSSPTNAQSLAQIKALSRQVNGVIRLLLNRLDSAD